MRAVRYSRTSLEQLDQLLAQGERKFGIKVSRDKEALVDETVNYLVEFPRSRVADARTGLCFYPVSRTPFILVYDYDDAELRIHFVLHKRADRRRIDPTDIAW